MKWSSAYTDFKAATNRVQEISNRIKELDNEKEWLSREMEMVNNYLESLAVQERVEKKWEEDNLDATEAGMAVAEEKNLKDDNAAGNLAALKKHYKGDPTQVSNAVSSCKSMEYAINQLMLLIDFCERDDKLAEEVVKKQWANDTLLHIKCSVLGFCERSGMTLSGNKGEGDNHLDKRSSIECGLAMEVCEAFDVFANFVKHRMKLTEEDDLDRQVNSVVRNIADLLSKLRGRSYLTLSSQAKTYPIEVGLWMIS